MSTSVREITLPINGLRNIPRPQLITRVLESRWAYYLVGGIGLILHLYLALPLYRWYDRLMGAIPLLILLFVLRGYVRQSYKSVPLLVLVAFQIYIYYSVPQFSQEGMLLYTGFYEPSSNAITMAMLLVVGGELVFILGYQLASFIAGRFSSIFYQLNPIPTLSWSLATFFYTLISFIIFALTTLRPEYIPVSVRFLIGQLFNIYLGLTLLLYFGYSFKRRSLLLIAYLIAGLMAAVGFIQGMLGTMISPLFILFLTRWVWGKVLPIKWIILVTILIIIMNPVKYTFRNLSWSDKDVSSLEKIQERLDNWFIAFDNVWIKGNSKESILTTTASRTSDLLPLTQVIDYVPMSIPYLAGEGLDSALLYWIPRVLWPSKSGSSDIIYNRYAIDFGYTNYEGIETSTVGASVFIEGYWHFGVYGVLSFLFISGLLLGMLFGSNGKREKLSMLICIVYVAPNIFVLQALTITLASLFSFLIGNVIALWGIFISSRLLQPISVRI